MKMNPKAMEAVLRALQKNCLDDMADDKSSPEDKMADAIDDSGDDMEAEEDPHEEAMETPAEELAEGDDEGDEDDEMAKLRRFFKTPPPAKQRPGTATMLAIEEEHPRKKKSIRDLMNG